MDKKICVMSLELMQKTVRYLETRPFVEVHQLLAEILKECNAPPEAPPQEPKTEEPPTEA